jgi:hypothetical protein
MLARIYECKQESAAERLRRKHVEAKELRVTRTKSALHGQIRTSAREVHR